MSACMSHGAFHRKFLAIALMIGFFHVGFAAEKSRFEIRKVFEYKSKHLSMEDWDSTFALLGPRGDAIYVLQGSELEVVYWKEKETSPVVSYADLPCEWNWPHLHGWAFMPHRSEIVAGYCGALYLIDSTTLAVKKELLRGPPNSVSNYVISPDGNTVAVSTVTMGQGAPYYVYLIDTEKYEVISRWPIEGGHWGHLAFSADGKLLAVNRDLVNTKERTRRTGIEVRRIPFGELHSEWWRDKRDGFLSAPRFVPGHPDLVATDVKLSFSPFIIDFWEIDTGRLVKRVPFELDGCPQLFSPDWTWAVGAHVDDPDDTDYTQEFIICDPMTGDVLYESPRKKWSIFQHLAFVFGIHWAWVPRAVHRLADLSSDGKYLLVIKHNRLELYEIIQHQAHSSTTGPY